MKPKKNPRYDLENKRHLLFYFGLFISLSLVVFAFAYNPNHNSSSNELESFLMDEDMEDMPLDFKEEPPPPPPPPPPSRSLCLSPLGGRWSC